MVKTLSCTDRSILQSKKVYKDLTLAEGLAGLGLSLTKQNCDERG